MTFSIFRVVYDYPIDGCFTLLRNAGTYTTIRRFISLKLEFSSTRLWEPQISQTVRSARFEAYRVIGDVSV